MSAMIEEQKAYERERAKAEKVEKFQHKTTTKAQKDLKQQMEATKRE